MKALTITIGATALMVAPPRFRAGLMPEFLVWTSGETVANGDLRKASNGKVYWCVVGGVCANEPAVMGGNDVTGADSIQWAQVTEGERKGFNAINTGATTISIAVLLKPAAGAGNVLNGGGGSYAEANAPVEPIYAVSSAAGGILAVQDL